MHDNEIDYKLEAGRYIISNGMDNYFRIYNALASSFKTLLVDYTFPSEESFSENKDGCSLSMNLQVNSYVFYIPYVSCPLDNETVLDEIRQQLDFIEDHEFPIIADSIIITEEGIEVHFYALPTPKSVDYFYSHTRDEYEEFAKTHSIEREHNIADALKRGYIEPLEYPSER